MTSEECTNNFKFHSPGAGIRIRIFNKENTYIFVDTPEAI